MKQDFVINTLMQKRRKSLTPTEIQQFSDLQTVYGKHNVLTAIQYAKTTQIEDVSKMLLQHCGFRSNLPASLDKVLPAKASAKQIYPSEKYIAGCRLEEATRPVEYDIEKATKSLLALWKSKTGSKENLSVSVEQAIRSAVRKFGTPFAQAGINIILNKPAQTEQQCVALYKGWLDLASTQSPLMIIEMLGQLGIQLDSDKLEFPQPLPLRVERYFIAKANRQPTQDERIILWSRLRKYKPDDIIHAMSCVPASDFTIEKVEKILSMTEPFGFELVASIKKKPDTQLDDNDQDADDWDVDKDEYGEEQPPHDPMRDVAFYDYSRFDENALEGEEFLDDYLIDEEE